MKILAIIYLIALLFVPRLVNEVKANIPESKNLGSLSLFLSVWLIIPIFFAFLVGKYINELIVRRL